MAAFFLMREHDGSGSATLAHHTFKPHEIKGCLLCSEAIHLIQREPVAHKFVSKCFHMPRQGWWCWWWKGVGGGWELSEKGFHSVYSASLQLISHLLTMRPEVINHPQEQRRCEQEEKKFAACDSRSKWPLLVMCKL